jgi:hypothetical protein
MTELSRGASEGRGAVTLLAGLCLGLAFACVPTDMPAAIPEEDPFFDPDLEEVVVYIIDVSLSMSTQAARDKQYATLFDEVRAIVKRGISDPKMIANKTKVLVVPFADHGRYGFSEEMTCPAGLGLIGFVDPPHPRLAGDGLVSIHSYGRGTLSAEVDKLESRGSTYYFRVYEFMLKFAARVIGEARKGNRALHITGRIYSDREDTLARSEEARTRKKKELAELAEKLKVEWGIGDWELLDIIDATFGDPNVRPPWGNSDPSLPRISPTQLGKATVEFRPRVTDLGNVSGSFQVTPRKPVCLDFVLWYDHPNAFGKLVQILPSFPGLTINPTSGTSERHHFPISDSDCQLQLSLTSIDDPALMENGLLRDGHYYGTLSISSSDESIQTTANSSMRVRFRVGWRSVPLHLSRQGGGHFEATELKDEKSLLRLSVNLTKEPVVIGEQCDDIAITARLDTSKLLPPSGAADDKFEGDWVELTCGSFKGLELLTIEHKESTSTTTVRLDHSSGPVHSLPFRLSLSDKAMKALPRAYRGPFGLPSPKFVPVVCSARFEVKVKTSLDVGVPAAVEGGAATSQPADGIEFVLDCRPPWPRWVKVVSICLLTAIVAWILWYFLPPPICAGVGFLGLPPRKHVFLKEGDKRICDLTRLSLRVCVHGANASANDTPTLPLRTTQGTDHGLH